MVDIRAERQRVEHQRHTGHQHAHEYQQAGEFTQHDMAARQRRRKQQRERLAAALLSDQAHRKHRHQHHQQQRDRVVHRGSHRYCHAGRIGDLRKLRLYLQKSVQARQKKPRENELQHGKHEPC